MAIFFKRGPVREIYVLNLENLEVKHIQLPKSFEKSMIPHCFSVHAPSKLATLKDFFQPRNIFGHSLFGRFDIITAHFGEESLIMISEDAEGDCEENTKV